MIFASFVRIPRSEAGSRVSTKTHPDDPRTSLPPSVVILGNDAQLAARPATPVQLAHACLAAGYRAVVPGSWGDELIAAATIQALTRHEVRPAIQCACPHVARRVLAVGSDLSPYLVSLVAPPVAAARYVRQNSPNGVRITYVGRCPAAGDDSIDARLTPEELLAQLAERGIRVAEQPTVFESIIPPDRRRHRSQPGGLPSPDALWSADEPTTVEMISEGDLVSELAEKVLAATNSLLDLAPSVGCACAGVLAGVTTHHARADVVALEPPRASAPVVDEQFAAGLEMPLPGAARSPFDIIAPHPADDDQQWVPFEPIEAEVEAPPTVAEPTPRRPRFTPPENESPAAASRRRPSGGGGRVVPGSMPVGSDQEGRVLPRAYVAKRRSPRGGVPVVSGPVSLSGSPERSHSSAAASAGAPKPVASGPLSKDDGHAKPPTIAEPPRHTSVTRGKTEARPGEQAAAMQSAHVAENQEVETTHLEVRRAEANESAPAQQSAEPFFARLKAWPARADREVSPTPSRPSVAREVTAPPAPAARPSDAELPIVQSVEPTRASNGSRAGITPALPVLVDQVRRTTKRVSGEVRALVARRPRAAIVVALTAFALLGVAIGYAAASRSTDATTSGEAGGQLEDQRFPLGTGDADSLRALTSRRDSASRPAAPSPARRTTSAVRRTPGSGARGVAPAPGTAEPAATEPAAAESAAAPTAARPVAAGSIADSTAVARRDSATQPAPAVSTARIDSLTAEREALRLELQRRQARLDSIARRVQEIKPDQR